MKTNRISSALRPSNLLLVAAAVTALTLAQYKAVGGDGITASPKARQMLNERLASAAILNARPSVMACPKCAYVRTAKFSPTAKGAEIMTGTKQVTYTHTCAGCDTRLTVAGEGKGKHQVATHKCTADVPNNLVCCASN